MADGKIRPVLWRVMPFEGVAEAHQMMRENKHPDFLAMIWNALHSPRRGKGARLRAPDPRVLAPNAARLAVRVSSPASNTGPTA